jgi:phage tail sheath protein FI
MSFNIGLNVVEVDGAGAPAIAGAAVSVGGFNIITRRGVSNRAVQVTSFPQFAAQFGSFFAGGLGAYLVKGFFDNGGRTAYINRVVSTDPATGADAADLTLKDGASTPLNTLQLEAGQRGNLDPGSWGDDLHARVTQRLGTEVRIRETARATIQSTALTAPVNMSALPSLKVKIDGAAGATVITFKATDFTHPDSGAATLQEISNAINNRTTDLVASVSSDNRLVLTSAGNIALLTGGWSSLQVTEANPTLGFPTPLPAIAQGTAAAITANGTQLANVSGFSVGDIVRISDGVDTAVVKLQSIVNATQAVTWTPALGTPGDFNATQTKVRKVEFDLTIAYGGTEDANVVETWTGLSMESDLPNYAPTVLNDSLRGSRFVRAFDLKNNSTPGVDQPAALAFTRFTPGRDGIPTAADFAGDPATRTGWNAFDPYDVQLLCCERTDPAIVAAALGYCEQRGDCIFVGAVPEGYVEGGQALAYGKAFQGKKVYGALYGPWIKVLDPLSRSTAPYKFVPPTGHVMGVFARVETTRGIWKAPAGDEANLLGALDVEYRLTEVDHTNLVKGGSVNGIRVVPGSGIVVDASRTLSTDTRWLYVNVRLLFNYVKSSLKNGLRWVRQEPNRDRLWNLIKYNSVTPFLLGLWRQGAFGTGTPQEVFTVICDASNNPPEEVEQGNLKVEVYFYPSRPAETIVIQVGQQPAGGFAAEG